MPWADKFDASTVPPAQGFSAHPPGIFDAVVSNTSISPTKDNSGGMFIVEFTTPAGSIVMRYNLWNQSEQAKEIARKQLSALCHATGIFQLDFSNDAVVLRNARCKIEVEKQANTEYMQVKRVLDVHGNEPGKPAMQQGQQGQQAPSNGAWPQQQPAQPQAQPAQQPMQQAPGGAWQAPQQPQAPQPQQQAAPVQQAPAWGNGQQQPTNQQAAAPQGWSQGPSQTAVPWGAPR